jgi:hypothetical protein
MQFNWHAISGPVLTAATALVAFLIDRHFVPIPHPAPLFVCIVALAASVGGIASGMVSTVIAVTASALFFLNHRATPGYDMSDLARMLLLAATAGATALITGLLRQKWIDTLAWQDKHHATADRLSAALDQVDICIALMYHGRDTGAWQLPEDELSAFIAKRTEMIRTGDSTPININLADGQVLRFVCTALPDGGRMLSYTPVTDLVRYSDDPGSAEYYRALRGSTHGLAHHLGAAE